MKSSEELDRELGEFAGRFAELKEEIQKAIVGYDELLTDTLVAIFSGGHVLYEGVPGLGKTFLVRTLSNVLGLEPGRIQCTPDLMPADILGTHIVNENEQGRRVMHFEKGPVFANLILVDEINRATPKTQAALLEVMQEHAVTTGGDRHVLPEPFFVMATQNPMEMEGTYPLPEAQLDRFMFKIKVPFPGKDALVEISKRTTGFESPKLNSVMDRDTLLKFQGTLAHVPVADHITAYAAHLGPGDSSGDARLRRESETLCQLWLQPARPAGADSRGAGACRARRPPRDLDRRPAARVAAVPPPPSDFEFRRGSRGSRYRRPARRSDRFDPDSGGDGVNRKNPFHRVKPPALPRIRAAAFAGLLCLGSAVGWPAFSQESKPDESFDKQSLALRTALHYDPSLESPLQSLVRLYEKANRIDELIGLYKSHVAQYPADAGAKAVLIHILRQLNRADVDEMVQSAAREHPDAPLIQYLLYQILHRRADPRALKVLSKAIDLETVARAPGCVDRGASGGGGRE